MTARTIEFNRSKAGVEDLELGVGVAQQTRNGVAGEITRINAEHIPFDATKSVKTAIEEGHFDNAEDATPDNITYTPNQTLRQKVDAIQTEADNLETEISEGLAGKATKEDLETAKREGVSEWDSTITYQVGYVVRVGTVLYTAININTNQSPPALNGYWKLTVQAETDLSGHATTADLETETRLRTEADAGIKGTLDTTVDTLSELGRTLMDLSDNPNPTEALVEANRVARVANSASVVSLRTDLTSEINNRVAGDAEAYRRITALGSTITQSANNAITTSIASGAIKTALDEIQVSGGGLQLSAFKAGTLHVCNLSSVLNPNELNLMCEPPLTESVVAEVNLTAYLDLGTSTPSLQVESTTYQATRTGNSLRFLNVNVSPSDSITITGNPNNIGFNGTLSYQSADGEAVDAIRILIDEAQTPDLFQTVSDNIPFNHPFKESPATQTVPAVETFTFSSDFEGIGVGKVVKIDSYFDFDLNPSNGSLPRCELTIMQAGRVLSYTDWMDAQSANPISYKAVAGGGAITFIGKATSTNELTQLLHMYTSDQTVYIEGKYSAIFNQLMDAGIALATASLKSRLTNLENLPVQDITALQNSYDNLLAQVNNPVLQALSRGTVAEGTATTVSRSALGDTLGAELKPATSPWVGRVLLNMGDLRAFPNLTAGNQQTVIGEVRDGWFYGKVAPRTIPAHTDTVDDAYGLPFTIPLGVQNQHRESTTSFNPTQQIPSGAVLQARLSMNIAGGSPAEFNLALGESNVFTNSGETATVLFQLFEGKPTIYITEGGENSLPLDNGTLTGFIRYTNAVAQVLEPASEVRLFEMTRNAPLIVMQEGETASASSNTIIIWGNNQRHDTGYNTAYANYYIDNRGGLTGTDPEFYTVADAESYDLTTLDADAYRMGLWVKDTHPSQKLELPFGLDITHTDGTEIDVGAEIVALKASGGGGVKTGFRLETDTPEFEVDLASSTNGLYAIPHELIGSCFWSGFKLEVLTDISLVEGASILNVILDGSSGSGGISSISKPGDFAYGYNESSAGLIDSASDIAIRVQHVFGSVVSGSHTGRVKLTLLCQRLTG